MTEREFYRRYLPHWHPKNATFFVTFRLAGSLPRVVIDQIREEFEQAAEALFSRPPVQRTPERHRAYRLAFARLEKALLASRSPRWLADPRIAAVVQKELHALDSQQYHLLAYCLMPNHVHLLVDMTGIPAPPPRKDGTQYTALTQALWLLKGRTGYACNQILGRKGRFWSREFYDHVVRDEAELARVTAYIIHNPVKAGLVDDWEQWPYTYAAALQWDAD